MDYLSWDVAEAIIIHFSKDLSFNSKNENNSNTLSRVGVEEDAFLKKKRARQGELEEVLEKRRRKKFNPDLRRKSKRKQEENEILPNGWKRQPKKLRRMEN
jgi:hypothetical protein